MIDLLSSFGVEIISASCTAQDYTVPVLGREEGYTVKYTPLSEGVPEGKAQGNF